MNSRIKKEIAIWALIFGIMALFMGIHGIAYAACDQFYPIGKKITVPNSVELCNTFYAVEFDTKLNGAIISVEKFQKGSHPARTNDFHPDLRLSKATEAEKSDYLHSGFDQGHLTPAADAINDAEMHDTFLLSNMTPQEPTVNRISWKQLEEKVRALAPDYVVTGAIYPDAPKTIGKDHVPIPREYYKIIYAAGKITAWIALNQPHALIYSATLEQIEADSNLTFPR